MVTWSGEEYESYGSINGNTSFGQPSDKRGHEYQRKYPTMPNLDNPREEEKRNSCMRILCVGLVVVLAGLVCPSSWHFNKSLQSLTTSKFDYIIVGGGPSGILVASKLARSLPYAKVLLLESGTASQSSVLATLQNDGESGDINWADRTLHLNRFDIPLMWSASALNERSYSPRHWPIEKTLLARALGGCGLVNAM